MSLDLFRYIPLGTIIRKFLVSPAHGALATLYAATDPEVDHKGLWQVTISFARF